jgi:hypothetical protein
MIKIAFFLSLHNLIPNLLGHHHIPQLLLYVAKCYLHLLCQVLISPKTLTK